MKERQMEKQQYLDGLTKLPFQSQRNMMAVKFSFLYPCFNQIYFFCIYNHLLFMGSDICTCLKADCPAASKNYVDAYYYYDYSHKKFTSVQQSIHLSLLKGSKRFSTSDIVKKDQNNIQKCIGVLILQLQQKKIFQSAFQINEEIIVTFFDEKYLPQLGQTNHCMIYFAAAHGKIETDQGIKVKNYSYHQSQNYGIAILQKPNYCNRYFKFLPKDYSIFPTSQNFTITGYSAIEMELIDGCLHYYQYEGKGKYQIQKGSEKLQHKIQALFGMNGCPIINQDNFIIAVNCGQSKKNFNYFEACLINEDGVQEMIIKLYPFKSKIFQRVKDLFEAGVLKHGLKKYDEALENYFSAKNIYEKNFSHENRKYLQIKQKIGQAHYDTKNYKIAYQFIFEAKQGILNKFGDNNIRYANILYFIAKIADKLQNQHEALQYFKQSKEIYEKKGIRSESYRELLNCMSCLFLKSGDLANAEKYIEEVCRKEKQFENKNLVVYSDYLYNKGFVKMALQKFSEASLCFQESLKIRVENLPEDDIKILEASTKFGEALTNIANPQI